MLPRVTYIGYRPTYLLYYIMFIGSVHVKWYFVIQNFVPEMTLVAGDQVRLDEIYSEPCEGLKRGLKVVKCFRKSKNQLWLLLIWLNAVKSWPSLRKSIEAIQIKTTKYTMKSGLMLPTVWNPILNPPQTTTPYHSSPFPSLIFLHVFINYTFITKFDTNLTPNLWQFSRHFATLQYIRQCCRRI